MTGLVDSSVSSTPNSGGLSSLVRSGYEEGGDVEKGGFWDSIVGRTLQIPVDYLAKPVANVINPAVNALVGTEFEQMRTPYDSMDAWTWNKLGLGQHDIYNPDGDPNTDDFEDRTDWGYSNLGKKSEDPDAIEWEDDNDDGPNPNNPTTVNPNTGSPIKSRTDDITEIYEELLPMLQGTLGADKGELNRQRYLELAKFGANLLGQPGGDLVGSIGRAAAPSIQGLAEGAARKSAANREIKLAGLKTAIAQMDDPTADKIKTLARLSGVSEKEVAKLMLDTDGDSSLEKIETTAKALEGTVGAEVALKIGQKLQKAGLDLEQVDPLPLDKKGKPKEGAPDGYYYDVNGKIYKVEKGKPSILKTN
jgi:hypothetical protein